MILDLRPLQVVDLASSDAAVTSDPPGPLLSDKWMPPGSEQRARRDTARLGRRAAAIVRDLLTLPPWSPEGVAVRRLMIEASRPKSGRLLPPWSELASPIPS